MIAGLLIATFLTLAYVPVLYMVTDRIKAKIIQV
jgi:multidrug efflux pump subunit AcrB